MLKGSHQISILRFACSACESEKPWQKCQLEMVLKWTPQIIRAQFCRSVILVLGLNWKEGGGGGGDCDNEKGVEMMMMIIIKIYDLRDRMR